MVEDMPSCCLFGCIETTEHSTAIAVSLAHLVCFSRTVCYTALYMWAAAKELLLKSEGGIKTELMPPLCSLCVVLALY